MPKGGGGGKVAERAPKTTLNTELCACLETFVSTYRAIQIHSFSHADTLVPQGGRHKCHFV